MTKSKKIFVGQYGMNSGNVMLWLDPSTDDSAAWHEKQAGKAGLVCRVEVGVKNKVWSEVVQGMLHEFVEASAVRERVHLAPTWQLGRPTDSYFLVMSHPQFSQVINEAGDALACALPDMEKAWKKWKKEK